MALDPYQNLAEIIEGTLSLVDYYAHRINQVPASLEPAKAAMAQAAADLRAHLVRDQAAD